MIFTRDIIPSCKNCGLTLSDDNETGFCTHFCENKHNGVTTSLTHNSMAAGLAPISYGVPYIPPDPVLTEPEPPLIVFEYDDGTALHLLRKIANRKRQANYRERHRLDQRQ